jgi:predicted transport protein
MWKIDILQKLVEQNHGKSFMPGWTCVGDYFDTDESFVTVPLHDQDLQNKLEIQVQKLKQEKHLSRDVRFLCRAWGTELPFLPVSKRAEFERFNKLMRDEFPKFDEKAMSLRWMDFVDGKTVFPKLPVQLRKYYKCWEKNSRIQAAMDQARDTVKELRSYIAEQVPTTPPLGDDAENLEQEEDEGFNLSIGDDSDGEQEVQPRMLEQDLTACGNLKWQQQQVRITGQRALWARQRNYMDQVMTLTKAVEEARFRSYLSQVLPGPLHPSSLPRPLQNDEKGQKMHLPFALAGR